MASWQKIPQQQLDGWSITKQEVHANSTYMPLRWKSADGLGIANTRLDEPTPQYAYDVTSGTKTIAGRHNNMIRLGRDKPMNHWSGKGGMGATRAGAIDIVVGRQSPNMSENIRVDDNFIDDAARVYVSQKSDIDTYFGLADGEIGNIKNRSSVGIKADAIRIVSRDGGIKLCTGSGQNTQTKTREGTNNTVLQTLDSLFGERNSVGGFSMSPAPGIELIAGNNSDSETTGFIGKLLGKEPGTKNYLQPVVMGDNMVECVRELLDIVSDLNGKVNDLAAAQRKFNSKIMLHTHITTAPGTPTTPSALLVTSGIFALGRVLRVQAGLAAQKVSMGIFNINYLFPLAGSYICSENVRTT